MKLFKHRSSANYQKILSEKLSFSKAKKEALHISGARKTRGKRYSRLIRIDFLGLAATTLFDVGQVYTNHNLFRKLQTLLKKARQLNEDGYFIRVRILFEYPYSVSAYSRIQAESTAERSSIQEPQYARSFTNVGPIDEDTFKGSNYVATQKSMLDQIQFLFDDIRKGEGWDDEAPNSLSVRFTPVYPAICCLFINDSLFFDAYLLAKERRQERSCRPFAPVVQVDSSDGMAYGAFEDHFRYLWDLDMTLDCQDATNYKPHTPNSLSKVKPPYQIKYESKARRIRSQNLNLNEEETSQWKMGVHRALDRYCADLSPTPANESMFITCSWEKNPGGSTSPHRFADELSRYLQYDLSEKRAPPIMAVRILQATPSEFLARQLYLSLHDTTIGLILLTKDIEADGKYYSKPNVYHELGYLMRHLTKDRIIIVSEKSVVIPSNIQDVVRFEFESDKLSLIYSDLLIRLQGITSFDVSILKDIFEKHGYRLDKLFKKGVLSRDEVEGSKQKMQRYIHNLTSKK